MPLNFLIIFFYSSIDKFSEFINNHDDDDDNDRDGNDDTTILCRWGKCVDESPQTADELSDLKSQMTWIYGGSDQSDRSKQMQGIGGFGTINQSDRSKEMQGSSGHGCTYEQPIPGHHATRERGRESVSLARMKQELVEYNNSGVCVVCAYELVHSKEKNEDDMGYH